MSGVEKSMPRLVIELEIESGKPRVSIVADSAEDEEAMIAWIRRNPGVLSAFCDDGDALLNPPPAP